MKINERCDSMDYNEINQYYKTKTYKLYNTLKILESNEVPEQPKQTEKIENKYEDIIDETGYINVGVYTALGALPVKDAVVTIYYLDGEDEIVLYLVATDESGRVPEMEVPVFYDENNPLQNTDFYFTTYNMRIQAIGYYTVNVLDLRVFPNTATNYRVVLIPVMEDGTEEKPSKVIIIPKSPADNSNQ
ncbi:MAG: hypothetical protein ACERLG_10790 [Sedimentibacter sp.]